MCRLRSWLLLKDRKINARAAENCEYELHKESVLYKLITVNANNYRFYSCIYAVYKSYSIKSSSNQISLKLWGSWLNKETNHII